MDEVWAPNGFPVKGGIDRIRQQYDRDRTRVSQLDTDMPAAFLTDALPPASAWNWCFIGMLPTREHPSE